MYVTGLPWLVTAIYAHHHFEDQMNRSQLSRLIAHSHYSNTHVATLLKQLPRELLEADSTRFYTGDAWQSLQHIVDTE